MPRRVTPQASKNAQAKTATVGGASGCKFTDVALALGRTTAAHFSHCRTSAGRTYYRGLTPANGESVEVDDVVWTSSDWLVTASDGTSYEISPASMVITLTTDARFTSRMVTYRGSGGQQVAGPTPVRRDANGFARGGPPTPTSPSNYNHPSHADCLRFLTELRAWSNYQNLHRPLARPTTSPAAATCSTSGCSATSATEATTNSVPGYFVAQRSP
ncbi:hypothetical protein [Leekyejoonella antrihumi]|uniref:Uncharacterized protein n=1 Tax=Leekyejoonella antrihumi TaxID=1660198 RepID=A0A563DYA4_9MICO|nr:hypothetical protein [Leekyejoonella antrihumi]TWP35196.1 hypothetical protein FGL98_14815 [Leekyejoonella antrihumi]